MQTASTLPSTPRRWPEPAAVLSLAKPITWFPPMWAYACGTISAGAVAPDRYLPIIIGIILAGPLVCGTSQAINDWFDRHVDAINEPDRVIPSGRIPGRWGLWIAITGSVLSMLVALALGPVVAVAALVGVILAWAYSAPPLRLKMNGWWGNAAVGFSYESLPWITAAAAATGALPSPLILAVAILYGAGAHGIMVLNDFKAITGDKALGIATLPVQLGPRRAAMVACLTMALAQLGVIILLAVNGAPVAAGIVGALLLAQIACMPRLLSNPQKFAIWYSALGVGLYVSGMMVSAFALRTIAQAGGLA